MFLVVKGGQFEKGDFVGFYSDGNGLYENKTIFTKIVAGAMGDRIEVIKQDYFVDGVLIGKAKKISSKGIRLENSPEGVISNNEYFMYSPAEDSFDSRYAAIGLVSAEDIIGRAHPLF